MKRILALLIILLLLSSCVPAQTKVINLNNVYYSGGEGGVKTALSLAGYTLVDDPAQADVIVLNGEYPRYRWNNPKNERRCRTGIDPGGRHI